MRPPGWWCHTCGGRLHLVATIERPAVVRRILSHLGLPTEVPQPLPARAPPETPRQSVFPEYRPPVRVPPNQRLRS